MKNEEDLVKAWSRRQHECGVDLCLQDLADEFILQLESIVFETEVRVDAEDATLCKGDLEHMAQCVTRLSNIRTKAHNMKYLRFRLGKVCNLIPRIPGNVVPYSGEENDEVLRLSYQHFDCILDEVMRGDIDKLKEYFSNAE